MANVFEIRERSSPQHPYWENKKPTGCLKDESIKLSRRQRRAPVSDFAVEEFHKALRELENKAELAFQEQRFVELAVKWKRETKFLSNVATKAMNIAYQKIIGMGWAAVPFIINDLKENGPNDWFWALHVITEANPITEDIAGNMQAMTEAWITWWKKASYRPDYLQKMKTAFRIYI